MAVSELPGNPNAVWTVRRHVEGKRPINVDCMHMNYANMFEVIFLQAFL